MTAYFESAGEVSNALSVESINAEKLYESGAFDAAASVFGDIVSRAEAIDDHFVARQARASQVEALFKAGRMTEAKEVFAQIDPKDWGENNVELKRIEHLKKLMLQTMALTLNIDT